MTSTSFIDAATWPAVVGGAVIAFAAADAAGASTALASYLPVAVAAVAIIALERFRPERVEWMPDRQAVGNDATFLVLVQMLLPTMLSFTAVLLLARSEALESRLASLWPHTWPLALQVVAMLVVGDVLRYWLHRWSHKSLFLWRFHAVHHSPQELYWLNVGRFHPLEKAVQYLFDTLPFVLLGVSDRVIAGYFVFYAVNGFFQHSNCRVRLGPLNWIISGPELHRWHHSRIIRESDNNFGNNLIIWDVLFGTRFLPEDQTVDELGLFNRTYPNGFVQQLRTPFTPGLDKASDPLTSNSTKMH